jgi:serine/threonine protein kinase
MDFGLDSMLVWRCEAASRSCWPLLWLAQLIYVLYRLCPQPCECIWNSGVVVIMSTASSFLDALPRHMRIAESSLTIGEVLGRGSFGVVNKGMFNGQPVCIKVRFVCLVIFFRGTLERALQSLHALNDPAFYGLAHGSPSPEENAVISELIAEVTMLATLHSDKIVSFRGVCFDAVTGRPKYIILELASGSLEWFLKSLRGPLPLSQFAGISEDVLTGMVYLHSREPPIMHRDLKPANSLVFLSGGGTKMTTKIGDVGLARFVANTALRHGTVAGTLYYMAPEVMDRDYNHAVDVFSFGIMMAEIVVAKMKSPPMRTGDMATRLRMVAEAVAFLRPLCEPLAVMIEGCCRTDVATRLTASAALELVRSASTIAAVGWSVDAVTLVSLR